MRNHAIDLMKCLAVLCIFNAHSTAMYPICPWLATGGALGDALFFFCSGYTLFMNHELPRFDTWYKRRLSRLWPSCMAWGFISYFVLARPLSQHQVLLGNVGWFLPCILVFYVILWLIGRYFRTHLLIVFAVAVAISAGLISYGALMGDTNPDHFKWPLFFPVMLLGAIVGSLGNSKSYSLTFCVISAIVAAFASTLATALAMGRSGLALAGLRLIIMLALLIFVYFAFCALSSSAVGKWSGMKGWTSVRVIGGLCLDFYLVKFTFMTSVLNFMFPFNIPLLLVYLLTIAYCNRALGRFIQQTMVVEKRPYEWRKIFTLL